MSGKDSIAATISAFTTTVCSRQSFDVDLPSGVRRDDVGGDLARHRVINSLAHDRHRAVDLVVGDDQWRRPLEDVATHRVHAHAQLEGAIHDCRGEGLIGRLGLAVADQLDGVRQTMAADVTDPRTIEAPEGIAQTFPPTTP